MENVNLGPLKTKMIDQGNAEEIRRHDHTRTCPEIGFAEPGYMLREKRFFLEARLCLGEEVHLHISNEDRVCLAHWRGKATPSFAAARTPNVVSSDYAEKLFAHSPISLRPACPPIRSPAWVAT